MYLVSTVNHEGLCPAPSQEVCSGDERDLCYVDSQCGVTERCCHDGCSHVCTDPNTEPGM